MRFDSYTWGSVEDLTVNVAIGHILRACVCVNWCVSNNWKTYAGVNSCSLRSSSLEVAALNL